MQIAVGVALLVLGIAILRFSNKPLALQLACLCLPVLAVALMIDYVTWVEGERTFFEAFGILTVLLIFVTRKPVYTFLETLPRPHRCFAIVFFLVFFLSHLIYKPRTTFPFVSWEMYSTFIKSNEVTFYQYRGLRASREVAVVNPSRLFPPLKRSLILGLERRFESLREAENQSRQIEVSQVEGIGRFSRRIRRILAEEPPLSSVEQKKQLEAIISSIGQRYNRVHPNHPISAVEVLHCTLSLNAVSSSGAVCRQLLRVEVQERKTE